MSAPGGSDDGKKPFGRRAAFARGKKTAAATTTEMGPAGRSATGDESGAMPEGGPAGRGHRGAQFQAAAAAAPVSGDISPPDTSKEHSPERGDEADKMKQLQLVDMAQRPEPGKLGNAITVLANHFEIRMKDSSMTVLQYHIDIQHQFIKLTRDDKRIIFYKVTDAHPELFQHKTMFVYDGDHLCVSRVSFKLLSNGGVTRDFPIKIRLPRMDREEEMMMKVQFVGPVEMAASTIRYTGSDKYTTPLQILDVILREQRSRITETIASEWYPFQATMYKVPRPQDRAPTTLSVGRVIWLGMFAAARLGQDYRYFSNFDVSHSGFYKAQPVIDFLIEILNARLPYGQQRFHSDQLNERTVLAQDWLLALNKEIKGLRVTMKTEIQGAEQVREFRVNSVGPDSAVTKVFEQRLPDGGTRKITVADYFKEKYGHIRYPNLAVIHVGSRKRETFVPLEFCHVSQNQRIMKKLSPEQTTVMIKAAAIDAPSRRKKILELANECHYEQDPWMKSFGLQVDTAMKQVQARVIPAPKIRYGVGGGGGGRPLNPLVDPRDGVWNAAGQKFNIPAGCSNIAVLVIDNRMEPFYGDFFQYLLATCIEMGMRMPGIIQGNKVVNISAASELTAIEPILTRFFNERAELIFVTLPMKNSNFYPEVKRVAEITLGVMTQCVTKPVIKKTMEKRDRTVVVNLALKINTKLGGVNSVVETDALAKKTLLDEPTLVLGLDVTHPAPHDKRSPSVASVVGNLDETFMRYAASIVVQKHRRESIFYVQDPTRERLMEYFKCRQEENEKRQKQKLPLSEIKPSRIIIFRDGVAENQFQEVLREEMQGFRRACTQMGEEYKPKITLVVSQKRHHTRLFPTNDMGGCGRAHNVNPGTVVDRDITHPKQFEFYLCSHFGIQGTSRPIRYHVLQDENGYTSDQIQAITYYFCHMFARCTRAVSVPAPIYYADLACRRARIHLSDKIDFGSDTMSQSGSGGEPSGTISGSTEDELVRGSTVHQAMKLRMYFT